MAWITESMLEAAVEADLERAARCSAYWQRYTADADLAGPDGVRVNMTAVVVDTGVSFLFGDPVEFAVPDDEIEDADGDGATETRDDTARNAAEEAIDAFWKSQRRGRGRPKGMATLLQEAAQYGGICGHVVGRLTERPGMPPRLSMIDPGTFTAFWDPDDLEVILGYKIEYPTVDADGRAFIRRQLIEPDNPITPTRWEIQDYRAEPRDTGGPEFYPDGEPILWPWPFPPIIDCQNLPAPGEYYGLSDVDCGVDDLEDELSGELGDMSKILHYHGHPTQVFFGVTHDQLRSVDTGIGRSLSFPNLDGKVELLEMMSDFAGSLSVFRTVKDHLHEVSRVPRVATEKAETTGPMSGVALMLLYGPLLRKTKTKRGLYGDWLVELARRALIMAGVIGVDDDVEVELTWPNPLPVSELEDAQTAVLDKQLGVSNETLMAKRGYDPGLEAERKAEAQAEALANPPVDLEELLNREATPPAAGGQPAPGQPKPPAQEAA